MFTNGKFKNLVAVLCSQEGCPVSPGSTLKKAYTLTPMVGVAKNWIALEGSYTKPGEILASTIISPRSRPEEPNLFAIYVSYYVKVIT